MIRGVFPSAMVEFTQMSPEEEQPTRVPAGPHRSCQAGKPVGRLLGEYGRTLVVANSSTRQQQQCARAHDGRNLPKRREMSRKK